MHHRASLLLALVLPLCTAAFAADTAAPSYSVTSTIKIGGEGGWDYATIDDAGSQLYLTRGNHMQVIDVHASKVTADIPDVGHSHGVALVPDQNRGFISDGEGARVVIFDLNSNQTLGSVPAADDADGIIYDPSTHLVLVACGDAGVLVPIPADIDPKSAKAPAQIPLGGKPEFLAADGKGMVYINLEDKAEVAAVDLKTQKVVATWPLNGGTSPTGLSIDPDNGRLFVGCRNKQMIVMSTKDGSILATLPIGRGVDATKFDHGTAFASCADGTLTAIRETSPGKFEVVQVIKTAPSARTMAVDHKTGTIYLPAADMLPPATAPSGTNARPARPRPIPGTFKVVVVVAHQ